MDMPEYLDEIRHAASETLRLVWFEHQQMAQLEMRITASGDERPAG